MRRAPRRRRIPSVSATSPRRPSGSLSTRNRSGVEDLRRVPDDRGAHRQRLFGRHVQVERRVVADAQFDHARHAHEIDPGAEVEAADDRRAGEDQHREVAAPADQRMRDRAAAAQMAEPEAVMAVDEDALASHGTGLSHISGAARKRGLRLPGNAAPLHVVSRGRTFNCAGQAHDAGSGRGAGAAGMEKTIYGFVFPPQPAAAARPSRAHRGVLSGAVCFARAPQADHQRRYWRQRLPPDAVRPGAGADPISDAAEFRLSRPGCC